MRAKTAEELETSTTLPLYRIDTTNRHSKWHVSCKLCGREGDTFTSNIKTYKCPCTTREYNTLPYVPKSKDTESAERERIRQRDRRRLLREGLIPKGTEIHHLYMLRCNRALTESIIEGILFLTPEEHEQWHKNNHGFKAPIYPEIERLSEI